jgi:dipeptidyl aminopeptidase/acylaminoacyl peptidase
MFFLAPSLLLASAVVVQAPAPLDRAAIVQALETETCVPVESPAVRVCRADYSWDGRALEALSFQPATGERLPGILLVPGFQRTARDLIGLGVQLAGEGFVGLAVTQPGFGRSEGPADYVGPRTVRALEEGLDRLKKDARVDASRIGLYGFSRGGMAAALIAVRRDDLKAAVFGAGIYDFQRAHDEVPIEAIRKNMEIETGMTREAVEVRSAVLRMDALRCPVLILHGDADRNVPVSQALLLQERLKALGKDFEIRIFPGRDHGIGPEVATETVAFFKKRLGIPRK